MKELLALLGAPHKEAAEVGGRFVVRCIGPDGKEKWRDTTKNLVVNEGLQKILDDVFTGGTDARVLTWYLGLTGGTPSPAAGDTLASHAGWTEFTAYTGDRKEWVEVRSGQTLSNSASKALFVINANGSTIGGCFLCGAATGTAAKLMSCAAFSGGNKSADADDTLEVTYEFSAANAA
jgi:hypothetical protein